MGKANCVPTVGWESLIRSIIFQALIDLKNNDFIIKTNAVDWLKSERCKQFCEIVQFDYNKISSIDFDNPENTLNFNFDTDLEDTYTIQI